MQYVMKISASAKQDPSECLLTVTLVSMVIKLLGKMAFRRARMCSTFLYIYFLSLRIVNVIFIPIIYFYCKRIVYNKANTQREEL